MCVYRYFFFGNISEWMCFFSLGSAPPVKRCIYLNPWPFVWVNWHGPQCTKTGNIVYITSNWTLIKIVYCVNFSQIIFKFVKYFNNKLFLYMCSCFADSLFFWGLFGAKHAKRKHGAHCDNAPVHSNMFLLLRCRKAIYKSE